MSYNQQKIIKYGQLVANMVMLHIVAYMTKAVNLFQLDTNRKPIDLKYELVRK